jgi:DNA-binding transcriptional LysR family regulator
MDAVGAGALDLGVVTTPDGEAPDGLTVTPWVDDELLLVVPPGHRLHGRDVFRWRELDGEPIVAFEAGTAVRALIDGALASRGVVVDVVVEVRAIESIQRMVALGMGVGFVSRKKVGSRGSWRWSSAPTSRRRRQPARFWASCATPGEPPRYVRGRQGALHVRLRLRRQRAGHQQPIRCVWA